MTVDESIKMTNCTKTENCLGRVTKCPTRKLWKGWGNKIKNYFSSITIEDLNIS